MPRAAAVALAVVLAAPAAAQPAAFEAGGVRYAIPAPPGYCSKGPAIDAYYVTQRRHNPDAVPDAVFARCGVAELIPLDLFAVKVRTDMRIERDALLAQIRAEMPEAMRKETLIPDAVARDMERRAGEAFDTRVSLNAGIKPIGVDDFCGYIAGVIRLQYEGGDPMNMAMGGCVTAIGGRPVYVFRYLSDVDAATAARELPALKRFAQSIQARKD